jgi:hypothetical protein
MSRNEWDDIDVDNDFARGDRWVAGSLVETWDEPDDLRASSSHTETNLTIQLLSCPALNLDRQAGRFL